MSLSFSILRNRNFRLLLFTRLMTMMGMQAQAVIVGWQIYSLTHDPFMLGLTGLAEAAPAISCALFSGYFVDRGQPRPIYLACIGALALISLSLFLIAGGVIKLEKDALLFFIFSGVFLSGVARSFIMPASFSLLPQLVSRKEIPAASSWLTSIFQIGAIAGPAVAGIIYGGYGVQAAWVLPASFLSFAFVAMSFISAPRRERAGEKRDSAVRSILAGWNFILKNPVLLSVMALDMFAVLFGGTVAMLPAYAHHILDAGPEGLGALRAAPAMGAVVTALIFAMRPMKTLSARRLLFVVSGFGVSIIGFGVSEYFWLSMAFLALSGAFDSVSMIIRGTIMQLLTPDHMRGRVSAVNSMFIISSNEIGAFESGLAARLLGLAPSVVFGGVATLAVAAGTAIASPKFRRTVVRADEA